MTSRAWIGLLFLISAGAFYGLYRSNPPKMSGPAEPPGEARARPTGEGRMLVGGTVRVHPEFAALLVDGGSLQMKLIGLKTRETLQVQRFDGVSLPFEYGFAEGAGPLLLTSSGADDFFVEGLYVPSGRDAPLLECEAWGRVGRPYPLQKQERADCVLAALAPHQTRTMSTSRRAPRGVTAESEGKADRREPMGSAPGNAEILLEGSIDVHPALKERVHPGGSLHLRAVSLDVRRPVMFKKLRSVQFPSPYTLTVDDSVSTGGLGEMRTHSVYVEVFYVPAGQPLYGGRENAIRGEAWGALGRPHPLVLGERADVVLDSVWTPELFRGKLTHKADALIEGWLLVDRQIRGLVKPRNTLTIAVIKEPRVRGVADTPPIVLAAKLYENIDPDTPLAFHFEPSDFRVRPIASDWWGYFVAFLESFDERGERISVVAGHRASPQVTIGIFVEAGFKIVLVTPRTRDPTGELGFDVRLIRPSPVTYE